MTWLGIAAAALLLVSGAVGYFRGFIKEAVSMVSLLLAIGVVWLVNPAVCSLVKEHTPFYTYIRSSCKEKLEEQIAPGLQAGRELQTSAIEQLPLPEEIRKSLAQDNNSEVYSLLKVDSFTDYVAGYIATILTNGVAFLVSFVLSFAALKIMAYTLGIMANLPVLRGINRTAGGILGLAKGLLLLWILGLAVTVLCGTAVGKTCMEMVDKDPLLANLYKYDIFVNIFINIFYNI